MSTPTKPTMGWSIYIDRMLIFRSIRPTRKSAINAFLDECCGPSATWETLKANGYSVQKVWIAMDQARDGKAAL